MKLKLNVSRVGDNFAQMRGDVVDVDDPEEAKRMIKAGQASAVGRSEERETAARQPAENAAAISARPRVRTRPAKR